MAKSSNGKKKDLELTNLGLNTNSFADNNVNMHTFHNLSGYQFSHLQKGDNATATGGSYWERQKRTRCPSRDRPSRMLTSGIVVSQPRRTPKKPLPRMASLRSKGVSDSSPALATSPRQPGGLSPFQCLQFPRHCHPNGFLPWSLSQLVGTLFFHFSLNAFLVAPYSYLLASFFVVSKARSWGKQHLSW